MEEDLRLIMREYMADVVAISESWNRDNEPITASGLELDNFTVI